MTFADDFNDGFLNAIKVSFFVPAAVQVLITMLNLSIDLTNIGFILSFLAGFWLIKIGEISATSTWEKGGIYGIAGFSLVFFVLGDWIGLLIQISCLFGPSLVKIIVESRGHL